MSYLGVGPIQIPVVNDVGTGVPVGTVVEFPKNKISEGFLKTTGEKYNPATFPALYNVLKTDVLPFRDHEYRIGDVKWFPKRSNIDPDFVPADGQELKYSDYPEIKPLLLADKVHQATDVQFWSDSYNRGHWVFDKPNTFNVPDMNGKTENTQGALFVRGDGKNSNVGAVIQGDAQRAIKAIVGSIYVAAEVNNTPDSALNMAPYGSTPAQVGVAGASPGANYNIFLDTSKGGNPTASENRSVNLAGCWGVRVKVSTEFAIKAFDNITPEGLVEVAGLVQENRELRQQIASLKEIKTHVIISGVHKFTFTKQNNIVCMAYDSTDVVPAGSIPNGFIIAYIPDEFSLSKSVPFMELMTNTASKYPSDATYDIARIQIVGNQIKGWAFSTAGAYNYRAAGSWICDN